MSDGEHESSHSEEDRAEHHSVEESGSDDDYNNDNDNDNDRPQEEEHRTRGQKRPAKVPKKMPKKMEVDESGGASAHSDTDEEGEKVDHEAGEGDHEDEDEEDEDEDEDNMARQKKAKIYVDDIAEEEDADPGANEEEEEEEEEEDEEDQKFKSEDNSAVDTSQYLRDMAKKTVTEAKKSVEIATRLENQYKSKYGHRPVAIQKGLVSRLSAPRKPTATGASAVDSKSSKPNKPAVPSASRAGEVASDSKSNLSQKPKAEDARHVPKSGDFGPDAEDNEPEQELEGDLEHIDDIDDTYADDLSRAETYIPSLSDPKLWLVKCDPGKENEMVLALMNRYILKEKTEGEQLFIYSAFASPAARGYVYIEADKEVHVQRAIQNLLHLKAWRIKLVPINEMIQSLRIKVDEVTLKPGSWVRMKRGLYKNDLAQVVSVYEQSNIVVVRLIPRLDINELKAEVEQRKKEKDEGDDEPKKKRRGFPPKRTTARPIPRLFNKDEIIEIMDDPKVVERVPMEIDGRKSDRKYSYFKSNYYRNGYLYKAIAIKGLITDDVQPNITEIERFRAGLKSLDPDATDEEKDEEEDTSLDLLLFPSSKAKVQFTNGDLVKVVQGELKGLTATVTSVNEGKIYVRPHHPDLTSILSFDPSDLKKSFRVGDHVKVVSGKHKDETGMVVSVLENDVVVIWSDTGASQIRVYAHDIVEAAEISTGRDSIGNYTKFDMVLLNDNTIGVITKVDMASFQLLTNRGVIRTVKLEEIMSKKSSKLATALDSAQNQMVINDVLRVIEGPCAGKTGTIKHIYRSSVFLYSPNIEANSGLFVVQARQCLFMGGTGQKPTVPQSPVRHTDFVPPSEPRHVHPTSRGEGGARKDEFMGKVILITRGTYKGLSGRVKDATQDNYRIELLAMPKIVSVKKDHVKKKDTVSRDLSTPETPFRSGSKTPLWEGGRTPVAPRTPALTSGGITPRRDSSGDGEAWSSQTPVWSARTPSHDDFARGFASDGDSSVPRTPASALTPTTPSDTSTPHPHTPSDHPITPRVPGTPTADSSNVSAGTPASPAGEAHEAHSSSVSAEGWAMPGVEVIYEQHPGVISEVLPDSTVKVVVNGTTQIVKESQLQRAVPQNKDEVIVLQGPHKGAIGRLVGFDATDAIVKFPNNEIDIIETVYLVKLSESWRGAE